MIGDSLVRASGAKQRIGSAGDLSNISDFEKSISDCWYTHLVPSSSAPVSELERNAEFLHSVGLRDFQAKIPSIQG